jgi:hypothetical protein
MKKTILALSIVLFLTIIAAWAQYFDGSHPGFVLLGKYSPVDGGALTNLQGNGSALTNLPTTAIVGGFTGVATNQQAGTNFCRIYFSSGIATNVTYP